MSEFDQVVFQNGSVRLGLWRCPSGHPRFENTGPIEQYLLVFPGTRVSITHAGGRPIRADRTLVLFYNRGQEYRRGRISPEGDFCQWMAVPPEWVVEAVRPFEPRVMERVDRPFMLTHGPSGSLSFLRQFILIRLVDGESSPPAPADDLTVEETVVSVLADTIAGAYLSRDARSCRATRAAARSDADLVERVRDFLVRSFTESPTLARVARAAASSPFHMCRTFRRLTGRTIHAYRNALRLRAALDSIARGEANIAALALDLGYSSHSHFTHAFRSAFGVTPARLRHNLSTRRLRDLSTILTA